MQGDVLQGASSNLQWDLIVQVQQQYLPTLAASQREMDMQLAECQHLREDLQHQLHYIQQTMTQLDEKEAHLKAQFQALLKSINAVV